MQKIIALALEIIVLTAPAHAQSVADFGGTGCAISLVADQPHVAEVLCTNVETTGNAWSQGALVAGDLVVHLEIHHGPGSVPDTFTITAPEGFVAIPGVLVLDEFTQGEVRVFPWLGF